MIWCTFMDQRFKNIKILIWDIDGTLYDYHTVPKLRDDIRESEYQVIIKHTLWSRAKTIAEFQKIYPTEKSGTKVASLLSHITVAQAAAEGEDYLNRSQYMKYDAGLLKLFENLQSFTHYLLVNGILAKTQKSLEEMGLTPLIFTEIVTSEVVGENKPSPIGFQYILNKTNLPPKQHLMIGDREDVDLVPAKHLGMKTCLVWSDTPSKIADVTLKTVYEVAEFLT